MARGQILLIGEGIQSGSPFVLNHLVYVTNVGPPPVVSTYGPQRLVDSVSGAENTSIPNSAGVYLSNALNASEPLRVNGGAIISGSGTDSVQIGRGAIASGTDNVAIGRGANVTSTQSTVVGAGSSNNGQQGVVIGFASGFNSCAGVAIGNGAVLNGNAGGNSGVAIGQNATATVNSGLSGPVVIGLNATARSDDVVIGANASSNQNSVFGVGNVVIGSGAHANIAQGFSTIIGYTAAADRTECVVVGAGASAAITRSIVIGNGSSTNGAATQSIVIGYISAAQAASNIILGGGITSTIANAMWLGSPNIDIRTVIQGNGDTAVSPAARTHRWTNGSGADNAAGNVTYVAPQSTGNAAAATIKWQTGRAGASSSALQTLIDRLELGAGGVYVNPDLAPAGAIAAYGASARRMLMFGSGTGTDATSIRQVGIGQALSYVGYRANGTTAAPTAIANNDRLTNFGGGGYDGATWQVVARANVAMFATEAWGAGAQGARIGFETTQTGTTTTSQVAFFEQDGSLTLQPPVAATAAISFGANAKTDAGGAGAGTLNNLPAAVAAGDPAVYLVLNIGGTPTYFAGWQ